MRLFFASLAVFSLLGLAACSTDAPAPEPTPSPSAKTVEVPDVTGMDAAAAERTLTGVGLGVDPKWDGKNTVSSDLFDVVDQSPTAGTEVDPSAVVTIEVGAPEVPAHTVTQVNDQLINVTVDATITARDAHWLVREVADSIEEEGGYFIRINCSSGATAGADNRQANGKFAKGKRGAALTALNVGESEVTMVEGATCP